MSVSAHLHVRLDEYDTQIRRFIPDYDEMLNVAASLVPPGARTIVDLGIGTGALAARCLARATRAHVVGIDEDAAITAYARRRLHARVSIVTGSFVRVQFPSCDAVVASLALHHIKTRDAKRRLYKRARRALRRGGRLITVDCQPAAVPSLARVQFEEWRKHLQHSYSRPAAKRLMAAWARDDVYVPLDIEVALIRAAGFACDVVWRKGAFAVIVGRVIPAA